MKNIELFIKLSAPLLMLLILRFSGTTHREYWEKFEEIEGNIAGPYALISVDHDLVFNDSISLDGNSDNYNQMISELEELGMEKQLYAITRAKWGVLKPYQVDSLDIKNETDWEALKLKHKKLVVSIDTLFENALGKQRVKIEVWQKISANILFSVTGNPDKFVVSAYNDKKAKEDEYGLGFKIAYAYSVNKTFSSWERMQAYKKYLSTNLIKENTPVTITRLKTDKQIARAYIITNANGEEIFYDTFGFEALKIFSNTDASDELNQNFSLWYNNWYVKLLAVIQLVIYVFFGLSFIGTTGKGK